MQTETPTTNASPTALDVPVAGPNIRRVFANLVDEGHDSVLTLMVVYGIAEGFSREAGEAPGDPYRFHHRVEGLSQDEPHADLDMETLSDRARDAIVDERLFDGLLVEQIEEVALVVGADVRRDQMPRP